MPSVGALRYSKLGGKGEKRRELAQGPLLTAKVESFEESRHHTSALRLLALHNSDLPSLALKSNLI